MLLLPAESNTFYSRRIKGAATLLCPNGDRVSGTFVTPSWDGAISCQFGDGSRFDGVWDYPGPLLIHDGRCCFPILDVDFSFQFFLASAHVFAGSWH